MDEKLCTDNWEADSGNDNEGNNADDIAVVCNVTNGTAVDDNIVGGNDAGSSAVSGNGVDGTRHEISLILVSWEILGWCCWQAKLELQQDLFLCTIFNKKAKQLSNHTS